MHRTTIMLPPDLKARALKRAHLMRKSLGELIRQSLEQLLQHPGKSARQDPFFADKAVYRGKAPRDLAKNHDKYLYGE